MTPSLTQLLALGTGIALVAFTLVWVIGTRIGNYGFLDAIWSLSVAILAPVYALLGDGAPVRRVAFTAVGVAWSLRLGLYILVRVWRHHPQEDRRYQTLRQRWPGPWRFLLFFELQALIAVVFALPFLLAALDSTPQLRPLEIAGLALAALATAGEWLSDWQAQRFRADPVNAGRVMDRGLWRYSRHPNYFFESLVWVGFALAAFALPYGWLCLACPALMLYFLLAVTGIPLTEQHSLQSRGDAYREYQRTTSKFIPWLRTDPRPVPNQS